MENSSFDKSSIFKKSPSYQTPSSKSVNKWLADKRDFDGAEGLWRINNKLYDLINFIQIHPGGADFLELTKGTDITELFETHHIRGKAEILLHNFYVRNAREPKNSRFTFCEDGFYNTLKAKVADQMAVVDKTSTKNSHRILDALLVISLISAVLAAKANNVVISLIAGISLAFLGLGGYNYIHQRDSWRMYCINLTGLNYREMRVSHVLSHHMFPNTFYDLEVTMYLPLMRWMDMNSNVRRVLCVLVCPLKWCFLIKVAVMRRTLNYFGNKCSFRLDHLITFILPIAMYILGSRDFRVVLKIWLIAMTVSSLLIGFLVSTSGHHHPKVYHEGDELPRSMDFGIFQMNAVIDRIDIKRNKFLSLIMFGNQILHHMFPTVDQSLLPQLNELFLDTCREFQIQLRELPWWSLVVGHFHQLQRENPIDLKEMKL